MIIPGDETGDCDPEVICSMTDLAIVDIEETEEVRKGSILLMDNPVVAGVLTEVSTE